MSFSRKLGALKFSAHWSKASKSSGSWLELLSLSLDNDSGLLSLEEFEEISSPQSYSNRCSTCDVCGDKENYRPIRFDQPRHRPLERPRLNKDSLETLIA